MTRLLLALIITGLLGTSVWGINRASQQRVEREHAEAAVRHLSATLNELRQRHDETDQLLAQTARQRDRLQREASRLAADLAALDGCPGTAIGADVAERVRAYRAGTYGGTGAGAENLD